MSRKIIISEFKERLNEILDKELYVDTEITDEIA